MEITVIEEEGPPIEATREERKAQIKKIVKESKLPEYFYEAFLELDDKKTFETSLSKQVQIPALLVRILLNFEAVIPIASRGKGVLKIESPPVRAVRITYAASEKPRRMLNSDFDINGLIFDTKRRTLMRDNKDVDLFVIQYPWNPPAPSRLQSGSYDSRFLAETGAALYKLKPLLKQNLKTTTFKDEKHALIALTAAQTYLLYVRNYNASAIPVLLLPAIKQIVKDETGIKHIEASYAPAKELREKLDLFETLYAGNFSYRFRDGIMRDLKSAGLLLEFNKLVMGADIRPFLARRAVAAELQLMQKEKNEETRKSHIREMRLRWLYIKKFGYSKFEDLNMSIEDSIMEVVDKKSREIIEIEYNRQLEFWNSYEKNNCPHLEIYKRLRRSVAEAATLRAFRNLKKLFAPWKRSNKEVLGPSDFIKCSNCGFDILCPHIRDSFELKLKNRSDDEVREFIMKYAGPTPLFGSFYCKICSERITYSREMDGITQFIGGERIKRHVLDDPLWDLVWTEASRIIRRVITFKSIQTNRAVNQFITAVVEKIYGTIAILNEKLEKTRTNTQDMIKNRVKLFSVIYVYALLLKIVNENKNKIEFVRQKPKSNLAMLFQLALTSILSTQNVLINRIENMTETVVKSFLYKSYKNITEQFEKTTIETTSAGIDDLLTILLLDPIYHYILSANLRIYMKSKKPAAEKIKNAPKLTDTRFLLNKNIKQLEESDYIYDSIRMPNFDSNAKEFDELRKRETLRIPAKITQPDSVRNMVSKMRNTLSRYVFEKIMYGVKIRLYLEPFTVDGKTNPVHAKFLEDLKDLQVIEQKIVDITKLLYLVARWYKLWKSKMHVYDPSVDLNKIYGDKAHKHVWNIFIYKSNGKKISIPKGDVRSYIDSGTFTDLKLVDQECSICHERFSKPKQFNVAALLEEKNTILNFYNFYEYRCPIQKQKDDYFHTFSKTKCTKCGITKETIVEKDIKYYNKFKSVFAKEHAPKGTPELTPLVPQVEELDLKWAKSYAPNKNMLSQFVNTTFTALGQKLSKNQYYNVLQNLGLTEGHDYDKILDGSDNPSTGDLAGRIARLDSYMRILVMDYNIVKNHKNIAKIPPEIADLVAGMAAPFSTLPVLYESYRAHLESLRRIDAPEKTISDFILESLSKAIVKILTLKHPLAGIGEKFAKYIMKKILDKDRSFALLKEKETKTLAVTKAERIEDDPTSQDLSVTDMYYDSQFAEDVDYFKYSELDYLGEETAFED